MFEPVQNLDFDLAGELERLRAVSTPVVVLMPMPHEKPEYIFGIIREPKPGQVRAPGTRRVPEPYKFVNGKREPNRRQRFSRA